MENKKKKKKGILLLLIAIAAIVLALIIILIGRIRTTNNKFGVLDQSDLVTVNFDDVEHDTLYITADRKAYVDGTMRLVVPRLDLDTPVGADTIPSALEEMPGLYEFSQMPSADDVNVSIAGHRDIGHREFYAQETITHGDYMYLVYNSVVYKYEFYESKIVAPDDWSVIKRRGFSALTLTTCDPIGTRLNRLITVGELVDIYAESDNRPFEISVEK